MKKVKLLVMFSILIIMILTYNAEFIREVYAYFTSKNIDVQAVSIGSIDIDVELGDSNYSVDEDGEWVFVRSCTIRNIGANEALLRISIVPKWVDENGQEVIGDISFIRYGVSNPEEWIDGLDGYLYYGKTFDNGQAIEFNIELKSNFFDHGKVGANIDLSENSRLGGNNISDENKIVICNENSLGTSSERDKDLLLKFYDDKIMDFDIWGEVVQCTSDAHRAVWQGKSEGIEQILDGLCEF